MFAKLFGRRSREAERRLKIEEEVQALSAERQKSTLAFAKTMLASIETNSLSTDEFAALAEILSRPGRPVSSKEEVTDTLRSLLSDPDYLLPHFDSLESKLQYEKQIAYIVSGSQT